MRHEKVRNRLVVLAVIGIIALAVAAFHFFVMDLNVFWAKLTRQLM
jgi:hypothetical protein